MGGDISFQSGQIVSTIQLWPQPTGTAFCLREWEAIPHEPEDGPCDPNDAEAARAWLAQADLIQKGKVVRLGKRGPKKTPTITMV